MSKDDFKYDESVFNDKLVGTETESEKISEALKKVSPVVIKKVLYKDEREYLWTGNDKECWSGPDQMSATRFIKKYIPLEDASSPVVSYFRALEIKTKGSGKTNSVSLVGQGENNATGSNKTLSAYMDFNGDRFPDIISKNNIQLTDRSGTLESISRPIALGNIRESSYDNHSFNVGWPAFPQLPIGWSRASGFIFSQENTGAGSSLPTGNIGHGVSQTSKDYIDMNGDGLPDRVWVDGSVIKIRYNSGYALGAEEVLCSGSTLRENKTFNFGLSYGFSKDMGGFGGGVGTDLAESGTSFTFRDINGDGLPDKLKKDVRAEKSLRGAHNIFSGMEGTSTLQVSLNTGSGFAPYVEWQGGG